MGLSFTTRAQSFGVSEAEQRSSLGIPTPARPASPFRSPWRWRPDKTATRHRSGGTAGLRVRCAYLRRRRFAVGLRAGESHRRRARGSAPRPLRSDQPARRPRRAATRSASKPPLPLQGLAPPVPGCAPGSNPASRRSGSRHSSTLLRRITPDRVIAFPVTDLARIGTITTATATPQGQFGGIRARRPCVAIGNKFQSTRASTRLHDAIRMTSEQAAKLWQLIDYDQPQVHLASERGCPPEPRAPQRAPE